MKHPLKVAVLVLLALGLLCLLLSEVPARGVLLFLVLGLVTSPVAAGCVLMVRDGLRARASRRRARAHRPSLDQDAQRRAAGEALRQAAGQPMPKGSRM